MKVKVNVYNGLNILSHVKEDGLQESKDSKYLHLLILYNYVNLQMYFSKNQLDFD